ncbi:hypothetical protein FOI42_RS03805 [Escherichia coli]|nr:hypothetical protein [Escherichia coli]
MKPIAGLDQFPFVIGGLQVTAAKIEGQVFVKELYVIKQRTFDSYDLISENFKIYKDIKITGRNKDKSTLLYDDDDAEIAKSLANNTFCIKEADAINNKYGFGIQYQSNKIKLHNGEIIFRRTNVEPNSLSKVIIKPDDFVLYSNDKMQFTAYFSPKDWPDQSGTWTYPTEHLTEVHSDKNSIILQAGVIDGDIPVEISFTPTNKPHLKSTAFGHLHDDPNVLFSVSLNPNPIDVKLNDTFTVSVVYDPVDYAPAKRGGVWSGYNTNVLEVVSEDENSITFKAIAVKENVHPTTSVLFTLNEDKTKTAAATIDITYAALDNVELKPASVDDKAGSSGTIEIIYTPDNAKQGGTWSIDDTNIVKSISHTDTKFDYQLLEHGSTKATFTPSADYTKDLPEVNFTVEYADLKSVVLTPSTVSNIKPESTGKIDITYTPNNAQKGGTWTFEPVGIVEEDTTKSTDDVMYYVAKKQGTTTATFTPDGGGDAKTVSFNVLYSDLTSLVLNPTSETVKIGDEFDIEISYVPDTAKHEGAWNTDTFKEYITFDSTKSTADKAHFKALKHIDKIDLVYSEGKVTATNECKVDYKDLESLTIAAYDPIRFQILTVGELAYIELTYTPDEAEHTGTWEYDKEHFEYQGMDPEAPNYARFLAIKDTQDKLAFTYKSGSITSNTIYGSVPFVTPTIITANPSKIIAPVGTDFYIDLTYEPDNAEHAGAWYYNQYYLTHLDDSTPERAHFKIIEKSPNVSMSYQNGNAYPAYVNVDSSHDVLTGISLSPTSEIAPLGSTFTIDIKYEPDTAYHFGVWLFDHEYLEHLNNGEYEKGIFKVIKKSDTPLTLTYKSTGHSATNTCVASYDALTGITLSPANETVPLGESFDIEVKYEPDTAQHIGEWVYDKEYLQYNAAQSVEYEKGNFTVIKKSDTPLTITFEQGSVKGNSICDAKYDKLTDFSITPASEIVPLGETFVIDITYTPDTAQHIGTWDYDKDHLELLNPDDYDKPQFKVLKKSDTPLVISFTSAGITKTNTCDARYDLLTSVDLTPDSETVLNGDTFTIDISYTPDSAQHIGTWEYDTDMIKLIEPINYEQQQFQVLKRSDTPTVLKYTSTNGKYAENTCTAKYDKLVKLTLSPDNETVSVGDIIDIAITYEPSTAEHKGDWAYDETYLKLDTSKSTADVGVFEVIAKPPSTESTQQISFSSAGVTTENTCSILYDKLESVSVNPPSINVNDGDTFDVTITYVPDTALKSGKWSYETDYFSYLTSRSTESEAYFDVIKQLPDSKKLTFTSAKKSADVTVIPYSQLTDVKLSPESVTPAIGDDFYIDITYTPDTAQHIGTWNTSDFEEYLSLESDSTPDKAHFQVKKYSSSPITLTYTSSGKSSSSTCTIQHSALSAITISPSTIEVKTGDDFYIDITYTPDSAEHTGTWNTSGFDQYLTLESDSTPDRAHFKAIKTVDELELQFICGNIVSNKTICYVDYSVLESISLSPATEELDAGDDFYIDITYTPDTADHKGSWSYSLSDGSVAVGYFELLSDSTPDRAHFKALKSDPNPISLIYTSSGKTATNKCTVVHDIIQSISLGLPGKNDYHKGMEFKVNIVFKPSNVIPLAGTFSGEALNYCEYIPAKSTLTEAYFKVTAYDPSVGDSYYQQPVYGIDYFDEDEIPVDKTAEVLGAPFDLVYTIPGYAPATAQITPLRPYVESFTITPDSFTTKANSYGNYVVMTVNPPDAIGDGRLHESVVALPPYDYKVFSDSHNLMTILETPPEGIDVKFKYTQGTGHDAYSTNSVHIVSTASPLVSVDFIEKTTKSDHVNITALGKMYVAFLTNHPDDALYTGTLTYDETYLSVNWPPMKTIVHFYLIKKPENPITLTYEVKEAGITKTITITADF